MKEEKMWKYNIVGHETIFPFKKIVYDSKCFTETSTIAYNPN